MAPRRWCVLWLTHHEQVSGPEVHGQQEGLLQTLVPAATHSRVQRNVSPPGHKTEQTPAGCAHTDF